MSLIQTHILIVRISMYVGLFFFIFSLLVFSIIVINRMVLNYRKKREAKFIEKWHKIIIESMHQLPDSVERVPKRHYESFFIMWNNIQDNLLGREKERLNELLKMLGMDKVATKMLDSKSNVKRILAALVLGNLEHEQAYDRLEEVSQGKSIHLVLAALHSLVKIDQERAIRPLFSFLKTKKSYPTYKMGKIMSDIDSNLISGPLLRLIEESPVEAVPRLMLFMRYADSELAATLAKNKLSSSTDSEVISAALKLLNVYGDARDVSLVKRFLNDEKPFVRMSAAIALGSIGTQSELPDLEKMLSDFDWWVRLRSAEAIRSLPGMTREKTRDLRDKQIDRFAYDILNHVIHIEGEV